LPIYEFGLFATFGILVAFCIALTLIPALLIIRGPSRATPAPGGSDAGEGKDALSDAIADSFTSIARKPRFVFVVTGIVVVLAAVGLSRLVVDNVLVEYFKGDADVVASDSFIRRSFGGSKTLSVVMTGEKPGDVLAPEALSAMDGLAAYLSTSVPEVGKVTGFPALVKRVNQVFNADESPDGIVPTPKATATPMAAEGAEPSFGFGFDAPAAPAKPAPAQSAKAARKAAASESIDRLAMIGLLSDAVAESGKRDLDAEELVAALKRAANYKGAAYYEIPADPARYGKEDSAELKALIGNYLVLLTKDILKDVSDDPLEPKSVKLNVQLKTVGQIDTDRAVAAIDAYAAGHFPKGVKVEVGGSALVEGALSKLVVQSQITSLPISLALVFVTLALFYRSGFAGLVGCIPLCISILINFGIMGAFGIKLNIGTALIASVAIGIGIDYTIHYMAAYHREYLARGEGTDFLKRTFQTSGKAIILNAVSVGAGFAVLMLSRFNLLTDFGALIALTMGTSALVALTVLPVILERFRPAFITRPLPSERKRLDKEESR
jgi:predicted RND superfamily exporter protein